MMNTTSRCRPMPRLLATAGAITLVAALASPAEAVQITSSSSTKDSGVLYNFRSAFPAGPITIGFELTGSPGLTAMLGQSNYIVGASKEISWMLGGGINAGYSIPLQEGGIVGIRVTPFLGYYHIASFTDNYNTGVGLPPFNVAGITNIGGLNYGARFDFELPSSFFGYAGLSAWTLTNGGWDRRVDSSAVSSSGSYDTRGMTLPKFWVGAGWSPIPIFTAFIGYSWMQLPTGMRGQANNALTSGGRSNISSFEAGVQVLWFSL